MIPIPTNKYVKLLKSNYMLALLIDSVHLYLIKVYFK